MNARFAKKRAKELFSETMKRVTRFPSYIAKWENEKKPCYEGLYDEDEVITLRNLDQKQNPHVLVIGSRITLKDFCNKTLQDVADGKSENKDLRDYTIFALDGQKFYSSLDDNVIDEMEKVAEKLKRFGKVILYIENFNYFVKYNLLNTLIPLLYGQIRIIAPIELVNYDDSIFDNIVISEFFSLFTLFEIDRKDYKKYLTPSIYELEEHHGVKYSDEAIEKVILLAKTFSFSSFFEEAYNEIDFSASIAKEKGRTLVNAEDVMEVIRPLIKKLDEIDEENIYRTAIHEAGHYTAFLAMEHLKSYQFESITIIPHGTSLGANQYTLNILNTNQDINFTRDYITFNLGGWAAEKVFYQDASIGSSKDLESTVLTTYDSIAYGVLGEENQKTSVLIALIADDSKLATSEERGEFNKTMDSEVEDGKKRAISIIIEHQTFVAELAKLLCERLILSEDELKHLKEKYY